MRTVNYLEYINSPDRIRKEYSDYYIRMIKVPYENNIIQEEQNGFNNQNKTHRVD